nr:hypothetical protein OH837_20215 [Streptomyces canus]
MEPAVLGSKPASGLVGRLVRKPFRPDGPGADVVDESVRLSALASSRGEQRTLGEKEVRAWPAAGSARPWSPWESRPSRRTASTGSPRWTGSPWAG